MKIVLVICLLSVIQPKLFAQSNVPNPSVPSANLGPAIQTLQVSNDLYNGRMNVSIPIYNYEFEGISFPIVLSYSGGNGIKPDEIPSWVGYGWNLQSGGFVHRNVRGKPDEFRDFKTTIYTYYCQNQPTWPQKKTELVNDHSYFSNKNLLATTNWYTQAYAASLFSYPNSPYHTEDLCTDFDSYNLNPAYDLAPDEFSFSVGGISGKFYLNHLNEWLVTSNDGKKYDVEIVTGEEEMLSWFGATFTAPRVIKAITLKSMDGIKYYFGNSASNATFANSYWDHSRTAQIWPGGNLTNARPYGLKQNNDNYLDLSPHTWHLVKVENLKTGSVISIDLKSSGVHMYKTRQMWGSGTATTGNFYYTNTTVIPDYENPSIAFTKSALIKVATRGWVPTAINFPDGVKIEFISTASSQLLADEDIDIYDYAGFYDNEEFSNPGGYRVTQLLKLDKIRVTYQNEIKKEFSFSYANSFSNRLQLSSVKEVTEDNIGHEHKFEYNNSNTAAGKLPIQAATQIDHWGYSNNKDFFAAVAAPYTQASKFSTYASYREPDATYAQAEILKKVTYPTGGAVEFIYQSHSFSKTRSKSSFSISAGTSNIEAGGVRIQKVRYYAEDGHIASEKEFEYTIPGTNLSSGILIQPVLDYLTISPNGTSWNFKTVSSNPSYYEGSHVTYTYAAEKQTGNGKILYEYTNYDNGCNDELPFSTSSPTNVRDKEYSLKSFKRGKIKNSQVLNETGSTISETIYHYEHENGENNKPELRSLYVSDQGSWVYTAVIDRIYQDHLISKEEKAYSSSGTIVSTQEYSYDIFGNIKVLKSYDSKGDVVKQTFKYNSEFPSTGTDNISLGINYLNDLGIKSSVIENVTLHEKADGSNSSVVSSTLHTYKSQSPFLDKVYKLEVNSPIPNGSFSGSTIGNGTFSKDQHYGDPLVEFVKYDSKGNPLEQKGRNNIVKSYLWGYNQKEIIAQLTNPGNNSTVFAYSSFESGNTDSWEMHPGSTIITGGGITGKRSFSGVIRKPSLPTGNYTVTLWSIWYANVTVNGQTGTAITTKGSWRLYKWTLNNISSVEIAASNIDEVRLYPTGGQMITYTYNPLIGMTSQCDANNQIAYYEYDELGRLILVKDIDKNILKKYCYNYAGQQENCMVSTLPKWENYLGVVRCKQNGLNENTGEQEVEQIDLNPYSATYNQTRWSVTATNLNACPLPCYITCIGEDKKCFNGLYGSCETGVKVYTYSYYNQYTGYYECTYHYEWFDGSWSQNYVEQSGADCVLNSW